MCDEILTGKNKKLFLLYAHAVLRTCRLEINVQENVFSVHLKERGQGATLRGSAARTAFHELQGTEGAENDDRGP